jgi:hypothetical protein
MHGFVIEERTCTRCRNLRTARFGRTSFCFNCRTQRDVPVSGFPNAPAHGAPTPRATERDALRSGSAT